MSNSQAVICSPVRTAIGTYGGTLKDIPAADLGAVAICATLERSKLANGDIDTVVMGNVIQAGNKMNPARQAAINVSPSDPATQWTGAVLGALALFVPSPMHGRIQAEQRTKIAQFCLPDENFEMHRFYCGLNGGTGASKLIIEKARLLQQIQRSFARRSVVCGCVDQAGKQATSLWPSPRVVGVNVPWCAFTGGAPGSTAASLV